MFMTKREGREGARQGRERGKTYNKGVEREEGEGDIEHVLNK